MVSTAILLIRERAYESLQYYSCDKGLYSLTWRERLDSVDTNNALTFYYCPKELRPDTGFTIHVSLERIHISTPNKYEYQYVKKPARMTQFQVAVKTHNDAHFALSASPHDSAEMLEIVLGGRQNSRSWISVGKMGEPLVSAATPGILSWDEFRSFWISWKWGMIQVRLTGQDCKTFYDLWWSQMRIRWQKVGRPNINVSFNFRNGRYFYGKIRCILLM